MQHSKKVAVIFAVTLAQISTAATSWANAPSPCGVADTLNARVGTNDENRTVFIAPGSADGDMSCDASADFEFEILREDIKTGDVVEIPILCGKGSKSFYYVDECVPAGTYRYAVTNLTPCGGFPEVKVEGDHECTRTNPDQIPLPYVGDYDWSYEKIETNEANDEDGGGCSVAGGPDKLVFSIYALTALFACGFMIRRRRK